MVQRVDKAGTTFLGKGANESLKVYLFPSKGKWRATLYNDVDNGREYSSELQCGKILYFKLKSCQRLTITCSTVGKMKVL